MLVDFGEAIGMLVNEDTLAVGALAHLSISTSSLVRYM